MYASVENQYSSWAHAIRPSRYTLGVLPHRRARHRYTYIRTLWWYSLGRDGGCCTLTSQIPQGILSHFLVAFSVSRHTRRYSVLLSSSLSLSALVSVEYSKPGKIMCIYTRICLSSTRQRTERRHLQFPLTYRITFVVADVRNQSAASFIRKSH